MKIQVKICGITRPVDARTARDVGASALGFIFAKSSPRYVKPSSAARIARAAGRSIAKVGVFVDSPAKEILAIARICSLDSIQLHGKESPSFCRNLHKQFAGSIVKAFRLSKPADLKKIALYYDAVDAILLDAYVHGVHGGTGKVLNWNLAVRAKGLGIPTVLSGGLTPENVALAIRQVNPDAVDVSSGVEISPGVKDPSKVRRFVRRAKSASR